MELATPLRRVLGQKTAAVLAEHLHLYTVADLLTHFPRRYAYRGEHTQLTQLASGEQVTIVAKVLRANSRRMRNKRGTLLEITLSDGGPVTLHVTFFNQAWRARELTPGTWGLFAGKVRQYRSSWQLQHPEYKLLDAESAEGAATEVEEFAGAIIPVYPASSHAPTWVLSRCVRLALEMLPEVAETLPPSVISTERLMSYDTALRQIHRPDTQESLRAARHRLAFDEAFTLHTVLAHRKASSAASPATPRHLGVRDPSLLQELGKQLPFSLTQGQKRVCETLSNEVASTRPMRRLLHGEVGSGKTVVALHAAAQVIDAGGQVAFLAPTEVLATQHAHALRELLGPLGCEGELGAHEAATRVELLTGSTTAKLRRGVVQRVSSGEAGVVVGTHALLNEEVAFKDLGLVIVDEQHRFGVEQRAALTQRGEGRSPHLLVMTATPIPRTVAMTVFGDLDTSSLSELPAGRSAISTTVVPAREKPAWMQRVWERVREEVQKGHQAYVVFTRIGEDDADTKDTNEEVKPRALLSEAEQLRSGALAGLSCAVLHGRLDAREKDAVMRAFECREIDVLLATTVIEVGVNVPNAAMMVMMDADRFGVSQLHQLRGRVGRGSVPGVCLLVTESPQGSVARHRLETVASTLDGFELAEHDLEQRREGDVLGDAQSGSRSRLKLLSLLRDAEIITAARSYAERFVEEQPDKAAALAASLDARDAEYLERA